MIRKENKNNSTPTSEKNPPIITIIDPNQLLESTSLSIVEATPTKVIPIPNDNTNCSIAELFIVLIKDFSILCF